jgi:hypothetical protein
MHLLVKRNRQINNSNIINGTKNQRRNKMNKLLFIFTMVCFVVMTMLFIHESIHRLQARQQGIEINEVCYLGQDFTQSNRSFFNQGAGWIEYNQDVDLDEILPTVVSSVVGVLLAVLMALSYVKT